MSDTEPRRYTPAQLREFAAAARRWRLNDEDVDRLLDEMGGIPNTDPRKLARERRYYRERKAREQE